MIALGVVPLIKLIHFLSVLCSKVEILVICFERSERISIEDRRIIDKFDFLTESHSTWDKFISSLSEPIISLVLINLERIESTPFNFCLHLLFSWCKTLPS